MQKSAYWYGSAFGGNHAIIKTILVMKLTIVLLTAAFLNVSAIGHSQNITFSAANITLDKVFDEVKRQTGYVFFFNEAILRKAKPVNVIKATNQKLEDFLENILKDQPLTYVIRNNTVIIRLDKPVPGDEISTTLFLPVTGVIKSADGSPLEGATIRVKGKNISTLTNEQGVFQINADIGSVLVISYIGFQSKEVRVSDSRPVNILLEKQVASMDTTNVVMSTGYQSISRERATGSFNVISGAQLERPSTNIAQRLIGTTAGMQATLDADGNPRFEIRGQSTLNNREQYANARNGNGNPLVVVDGFAIQGDFTTVNPNDVETVSVLKDAAAASIWGARAANGVIVVTTKKAKRGTPLKVTFSAFARISSKADLDYINPLAPSAETVDFEKRLWENWTTAGNNGTFNSNNVNRQWSPVIIAMNEAQNGFITTAQRDTLLAQYRSQDNRQQIRDELMTNPFTQQYNLNLSGASAGMSNNLSLMYETNKSNFRGTDNNRYNLHYNTNADVFKWLQVNVSANINYGKFNNNGVSLANIQFPAPYEMLKNPDGSLANISRYYMPAIQRYVPVNRFPYSDFTYNPIQEIANRSITSEELSTRFLAGLRFTVIKGLTVDSRVQYELFNVFNRNFRNEATFEVRDSVNRATPWNVATGVVSPSNLPKGGMLRLNRTKVESYNFRNQINYDRRFGVRHELTALAGTEIRSGVTQTLYNPTAYGYNDQTLGVGNFPNGPGGAGARAITNWYGSNMTLPYTNSFTYQTERFFSLYGNAGYTFDDKYMLTGSVRTDASNLISDDPNIKYSPFWSVGLGWHIAKENFIHHKTWIDRLTLRGTFGYFGDVDKTTSPLALINLGASPNPITNDLTATIGSYGNPTLRWQKTQSINLGADYSFFRGKLYGKVEVYSKKGADLIANISIAAINGNPGGTAALNNAAMDNRGIEIELGTSQPFTKKIVWRGNLNFAYNDNKITDLFVTNYNALILTIYGGSSSAYVEGQNANAVYRYQYTGVQNNLPTYAGPDKTFIPVDQTVPTDARAFLLNIGTSVAPYTLGFINNFQVYDFNLSFILTGKFGHVFQRQGFNYPAVNFTRTSPNSKLSEVVNGDPSQIVPLPLNTPEPGYFYWANTVPYMSYLIESASHVRMQEVSLGYGIPQRLLSMFRMNRLEVFAQGNNLFTVVANNFGEDPEYPKGTFKPQPRITFGVRCEF